MITSEELSKILGISRGTISRVLNGNPNVNAKTRQLVLDAVEKYGYQPNHAARSLITRKKFRIAAVVFSEPVFFWNQIKHGIDCATSDFAHTGVEINFIVTDIANPGEQIDVIKRLVEEEYDAIALAPNDPQIMSNVIDEASAKGIPVLLFNVDIPNSNRICYVGSNYLQSGELAAEVMAKTIGCNAASVSIFSINEHIIPIEQRILGFRDSLSAYPNVKIDNIYRFDRLSHDLYEFSKDVINKGTNGLFVTFDALPSVAKAITDCNMIGKISLIGFDLNKQIAHYLNTQAITATIFHEPFSQGYNAISILHRYLYNKKSPEKSMQYTKLEILMQHNLSYYREIFD